jgi:DNA replicative helicase MCM subunit Mcm2 (Cdc46/Mcm family)
MPNLLQNIDFQSTILSRFDLIFIVRDEHNEARDQVISSVIVEHCPACSECAHEY